MVPGSILRRKTRVRFVFAERADAWACGAVAAAKRERERVGARGFSLFGSALLFSLTVFLSGIVLWGSVAGVIVCVSSGGPVYLVCVQALLSCAGHSCAAGARALKVCSG